MEVHSREGGVEKLFFLSFLQKYQPGESNMGCKSNSSMVSCFNPC